ncbi:MAG TPA: MFS transporter [Thermoleophilaceae bacterium]|jgi:EmrB/QacA subfamily drug resistance transporter
MSTEPVDAPGRADGSPQAPEGSEATSDRARWRAFLIVAPAIFITALDMFIVNIAFPDILRDFEGSSISALSWVLNAYTIVFAALLVPMGKLGDVIGRKLVFQVGTLLFVAGSVLCATAPSPGFLIGARVLQGVGAAAITPNSLGLVLPLFPAHQRTAAIGAWAALGGVGAAMGPPLGGLLTEASWRWIFVVNVPIGLAIVVLVYRRLSEVRDARALLPDAIGSALAVTSVGLFVAGLVQGDTWDWDTRVLACFAAALVLGTAFVTRSLHHRAPVIELDLFKSSEFSLANVANLVFYAGFGAFLLGCVLFLTQVWHYSVIKAGFALTPPPTTAAIFAGISSRLANRLGPASVGAPGGIIFAVACLMLTGLGPEPDYVGEFLPAGFVAGVGAGLLIPAFMASAMLVVPPERFATGIGGSAVFRQIGAAFGVAAFVALFGTPAIPEVLDAFDRTYVYMAACGAAASLMLFVLAMLMRARRPVTAEIVPATGTPAA